MKKDFKKWMEQKAKIHNDKIRPFFHEREVWFSSLGENVGFEQDGSGNDYLRPVLIVKKFNNEIFWGVPLTKSKKDKVKNSIYYYTFSFLENVISVAILSQVRLIDAKRLARQIGSIEEYDFEKLKKKLKELLP